MKIHSPSGPRLFQTLVCRSISGSGLLSALPPGRSRLLVWRWCWRHRTAPPAEVSASLRSEKFGFGIQRDQRRRKIGRMASVTRPGKQRSGIGFGRTADRGTTRAAFFEARHIRVAEVQASWPLQEVSADGRAHPKLRRGDTCHRLGEHRRHIRVRGQLRQRGHGAQSPSARFPAMPSMSRAVARFTRTAGDIRAGPET